jgi:hypothetical protein
LNRSDRKSTVHPASVGKNEGMEPSVHAMKNELLHTFTKLASLLLVAAFAINANAQTGLKQESRSDFSLGVEGGTTGFGPVLMYTASPKLNFALSYGLLSFDGDNVKGDKSRYDYDVRLSNLATVANWHPWGGHFHLTAGAFLYDHRVDFTARPRNNKSFEIGDHSYDKTQITSVTGKIDTGSTIAPYVGVGWTWVLGKSGISLITNFGLMFTQGYDTKLTATGPAANDPTFIADLHKEQDDLSDIVKVFPVLKAGFVYRF